MATIADFGEAKKIFKIPHRDTKFLPYFFLSVDWKLPGKNSNKILGGVQHKHNFHLQIDRQTYKTCMTNSKTDVQTARKADRLLDEGQLQYLVRIQHKHNFHLKIDRQR